MNQTDHNAGRVSTETRAEMERLDHKVKIGLLVVSSLTVVLLAVAALGENVFARWRLVRRDYARILNGAAADDFGRSLARAFKLEIEQIVIPATGAVDRCITCHTGIDDPRMRDLPQPFTTHPGRYLQIHEPTQFGCTVCHEGQGHATTTAAAHGRVPFWDRPLLERPYRKTSCSKCHAHQALHGPARLLDRADDPGGPSIDTIRLDQGWRLMEEKGCLGCHAIGGKGGNLSRDLTLVGDKTLHEFTFAHLDGDEPRRVTTWLEQHFLDPQRVAPGSLMPNVGLTEEEAAALTAVMLSLRSKSPAAVRPATSSAEPPRSGGQLYAMYCSACHGADGSGNAAPGINTPSINNSDVLGVADDTYLRLITASGRRGTYMPAWGPGRGNLTPDEIERIVETMRAWQPAAASAKAVRAELGDPRVGRSYYRSLCASCHGARGGGGIGNSLNSPSFRSIATDRFLAEAIIGGRPGTAMPSWGSLTTQAVSDIVAFIRERQAKPPAFAAVQEQMGSQPRRRLASDGQQLYGLYCASCHGRQGEGGIGPRLSTPDLLRVVDDRYLYRAIVEGRPETAMPAWRQLEAEQVAAILAYLRSWQRGAALALGDGVPEGDHIAGEVHYRMACQGCHGERGSGGSGPRLASPAFLRAASDAQLFHWIGRGRIGTAMRGFLPEAQGPVDLTAEQIGDVIAYLRFAAKGGDIPLRRTGAGDAAVGAELFRGTCAACHGRDGEGASGPQLNNAAFLTSASDGFLAATIVLGREGTPMQPMVHGLQGLGQIPPEQVRDLIAFMRLWEDPATWRKPRRAVEMSERAIAAGRELFLPNCASCHGPNGRGLQEGTDHYAPALNNPDFLAAASDGFLLATIARGRGGTPMRPFGKGAGGIVSFTPEEISDIVSFIRSWQDSPALAGGPVP